MMVSLALAVETWLVWIAVLEIRHCSSRYLISIKHLDDFVKMFLPILKDDDPLLIRCVHYILLIFNGSADSTFIRSGYEDEY
ncbi:hypothetical protein C0J52_14552 [Blattella germanica]|nr:hypothetical protein C0J52_14552 [Blattella germanica]